jgi:hypothetical protein
LLVINVNHALGDTLQLTDITGSFIVDLYEAVTRLIVIYGDKWTLINKLERALMTSERKILRKIYWGQYVKEVHGE